MPANKKYLLKSKWARASKIIAAILGGFLATISLHGALAILIGFDYVLPTSLFSTFIVWSIFMLVVYWVDKPWKSWSVLLSVTLVCSVVIFIWKM
ncbi:MAG: hypothetical protein AAF598_15385 [Bacteroidota bacterium]